MLEERVGRASVEGGLDAHSAASIPLLPTFVFLPASAQGALRRCGSDRTEDVMLVIVSDLHFTDGTSGETVRSGAFKLFRDALSDLAYGASWRANGKYRPVEDLHLILLGDVLDVIRSTQWLQVKGVPSGVRPWHDPQNPDFIDKVGAI